MARPDAFRPDKPRRAWLRRCAWGVLVAVLGLGGVGGVGGGWAGAEPAPLPAAVPTFEQSGALQPAVGGSARCIECHRFDHGMTHPVNVKPSMAVPAGLPLEAGAVTCLTCHEVLEGHGSARKTAVRVGARAEEAGLCVQCHQAGATKGKASHTLAGNAHLVRGKAGKQGAGLDAESTSCMGCHDGVNAGDAGSHSLRRSGSEPAADHPIGIAMRGTSRTRDGDFGMANPASLDRRIRLFDGAVGCGSCHSVYSREPAELVKSNRGSALCLSCHTP